MKWVIRGAAVACFLGVAFVYSAFFYLAHTPHMERVARDKASQGDLSLPEKAFLVVMLAYPMGSSPASQARTTAR